MKLRLDIHTNMKMLGKRAPYSADYQVCEQENLFLPNCMIDSEEYGLRDQSALRAVLYTIVLTLTFGGDGPFHNVLPDD